MPRSRPVVPSSRYDLKRVYTLHVFKDPPGSNWTDPNIHVFPLSSKSAERFNWQAVSECAKPEPGKQPGSRDGVVNLYRLPSDQLSFLEQYVAKLNEELEEHTTKLAEDWKASLDQVFDAQMKRNEEAINKIAESQQKQQNEPVATSNGSGGEKPETTSTEKEEPEPGDTGNTHTEPLPSRHWSSPLGPNPALFETPWTIEDVGLLFIPETVSLESIPGGSAGFSTFAAKSGHSQGESHNGTKLEVATYGIAPESLYSFALLLSRCTGVEVPLHSGQTQAEARTTMSPGFTPAVPSNGVETRN